MKLINLTLHGVTIFGADDQLIAQIAPSGTIARVESSSEVVGQLEISGHQVPLVSTKYGAVKGLPDPAPDVIYIVSLQTLEACQRGDVVAPDTNSESVVRDSAGRIIGVRRFHKGGRHVNF